MDPDSRFRETLDSAAMAAEAVYDHDAYGESRGISADEQNLEVQLDRMAGLVGQGLSATVLVSSGGDVAVKFHNEGAGYTIVALRGTDGMGDVASYPAQGAGLAGDLARKTVKALEGETRVDLIVGHSWGGYEASNVGRRIDQVVGYVVNFQGPEIHDVLRLGIQILTMVDMNVLQVIKQSPSTVIIKSDPAGALQLAIQSLGLEFGADRRTVPVEAHGMIGVFEYITGHSILDYMSETDKLRSDIAMKSQAARDAAMINVGLAWQELAYGYEQGFYCRVDSGGNVIVRSNAKQESSGDRHGSGGGGADSGRVGNSVSSISTSSSKNDYGYEKTTTTTTYKSGISQTTATEKINTPSGPQTITKITTTPVSKPADEPRNGPQPILLDLDGNGVEISEFQNSTQFQTGKDGLSHRTSWAGTGDGVLFYDAGNDNLITEEREYVFTEWNPTVAGDLEALRSVWDTNGDGKLTAADAEFATFKVMVTHADGSTSVQTLAALGITEINPTANTVNIELPDGSVITGQTTFTRVNGTTGTVANTTLTADAAGYRVTEVVSTDVGGNRVLTQTGYDADGGSAEPVPIAA